MTELKVPETQYKASLKPECSSPGADEPFGGLLTRKHVREHNAKKASKRAWIKVYVVLQGPQISFYKDATVAQNTPEQTYKGEAPLFLLKARASAATDYVKRKHVFRLKLSSEAEFLFEAENDGEMNMWISRINFQFTRSGSIA